MSFFADRQRKRAEQSVALYTEPARIYFMRCDCPEGFIKIGFGRDPERRLPALQVGSPYHLSIMATMAGTFSDERTIHERFKEARTQGEWFRPTPELLAFIEANK